MIKQLFDQSFWPFLGFCEIVFCFDGSNNLEPDVVQPLSQPQMETVEVNEDQEFNYLSRTSNFWRHCN